VLGLVCLGWSVVVLLKKVLASRSFLFISISVCLIISILEKRSLLLGFNITIMFFLTQLAVYFAALTWVQAEVNIRQINSRIPTSSSASSTSSNSLIVDLGYGVYEGYYNDTSKLNIYKG
jgi:hypothetical protein